VSGSSERSFVIHVSQIDEFLAERLLESGGSSLAISVRNEGRDGRMSLAAVEVKYAHAGGEGVDFELSACECGGLYAEDIGIYLGRPVYTSSAHELFDFLLAHLASFDCFIEFTGNAWSVTVVNAVRE
jgi:hypothetical protein